MPHEIRRRVYQDPPLLEAVVEFQFEPGTAGWDSIFFGKIHEKVEADFPRVETISGPEVKIAGKGSVSLGPAPELKRLIRGDGGVVVTVGPDLLGFSVLPPKIESGHPGWEWLCNKALELLDAYRSVVKPQRIRRVGVRYINGIKIDPDEFQLGALVASESGFIPLKLLDERNPFSYRLERVIDADQASRHVEILQLAAQPTGVDVARLVLDVDQVLTLSGAIADDSLRQSLDKLHDGVHVVFETVIRSDVLESFRPVTTSE